jgi:hypothetical protein
MVVITNNPCFWNFLLFFFFLKYSRRIEKMVLSLSSCPKNNNPSYHAIPFSNTKSIIKEYATKSKSSSNPCTGITNQNTCLNVGGFKAGEPTTCLWSTSGGCSKNPNKK